ncbi:unnamed protein product [Fraxinus pennsylvanica]|uniref:At1g61320/AtMIF1 LRR domain-containing protein n=1 Tax=Fraxinus pennsylvanica TaxID=56036 RepID=A0AAD2A3Z7_9LAMI|nr:unnamed protein product [Fraxinus pennsylvanica]
MKFVMTHYEVLLLHQRPITKLSVVIPELGSCSEIDHLMYILWKNSVEEFTFRIKYGEEYRLPSSLFMSLQLKHLNLSTCLFNPRPSFKGFNRMIMLELCEVTINHEVIESLISSCLLLKELVLHVPNKFDYLEINAPMLELLALTYPPTSVRIKKSPLLEIV